MAKPSDRSIVIIGTLDTKGDQLKYLMDQIKDLGHQVTMIDVGVLGDVPFPPTFSREEVAEAAGTNLQDIVDYVDENRAMNTMGEGASKLVNQLHTKGEINGIIAVGGSTGSSLALDVLGSLPLGLPKLFVSTVAYLPAIIPDWVENDIMMLPWVAGLWGLNSLSKQVLETAAGVITGAAGAYDRHRPPKKKVVAITTMGQVICRYVGLLKPELEKRGYDVAVFHCTGMSGRLLERAIEEGLITAILDLSVGVELVNEVTGGACTAGRHRLEAAGRAGIPQIVSPGPIEAFHWGSDKPLPEKYKDRPQRRHNRILNVLISSNEERAATGRMMAEKLNMAKGPTALVLPMKGNVHLGHEGEEDVDPEKLPPFLIPLLYPEEGLKAFRAAFDAEIKPGPEVVVLEDASMNDQKYIDTVLSLFDEMVS
jgi:uncharacterized protein (UPF0261 family)